MGVTLNSTFASDNDDNNLSFYKDELCERVESDDNKLIENISSLKMINNDKNIPLRKFHI